MFLAFSWSIKAILTFFSDYFYPLLCLLLLSFLGWKDLAQPLVQGFVGLHVSSIDAVWCVGRCFPHLGLADSDYHICICLNVLICQIAKVHEGLCLF